MDYADLAIIDLAKATTPDGRAELAASARDAMRDIGFFYVINHGLSFPEVCQLLIDQVLHTMTSHINVDRVYFRHRRRTVFSGL